jgi:phenylacetate-CoA ligase
MPQEIKKDFRSFGNIYAFLLRLQSRLPKSWIYPREALAAIDLLSKQDQGQDIEPLIRERLVGILQTALTSVPHYRDLRLGINPREIRGDNVHEVLKQFPYLHKSTIMAEPERFISERYKPGKLMVDTSGGSTGQGIKIYTNVRQKYIERCFFDYTWEKVAQFRHSARIMRMNLLRSRKSLGEAYQEFGGRLVISPYHLNPEWIDRIFEKVKSFQVEYVHSYPSCFEYLVDYMLRKNLRLESIRGIFLASERVFERQLDLIHEVFPGVPVVFHYGLGEKTNLAWGSYQAGQIRYHFEKVYGFTENYLDPDGRAEIVGTSYWNDVMPLIRYRTQDMGRVENQVMNNLDGRNQEFLIARDGAKIPGFTICIDKFTWNYVEVFQVIQNEPGKLEFHIKPRPSYTPEIEARIMASQQEKWSQFFDMKIIIEPEIPRTIRGKLRLIINNIPDPAIATVKDC